MRGQRLQSARRAKSKSGGYERCAFLAKVSLITFSAIPNFVHVDCVELGAVLMLGHFLVRIYKPWHT